MPKFVKATFYAESFYIERTDGCQHKDLHLTSHSVDKALDGSQKRKKRKSTSIWLLGLHPDRNTFSSEKHKRHSKKHSDAEVCQSNIPCRVVLHSADKALDGSQKRKRRKVLDESRDFIRITHRVVYRAKTKMGQSTQQVK